VHGLTVAAHCLGVAKVSPLVGGAGEAALNLGVDGGGNGAGKYASLLGEDLEE
jgi:hypothetical protein